MEIAGFVQVLEVLETIGDSTVFFKALKSLKISSIFVKGALKALHYSFLQLI